VSRFVLFGIFTVAAGCWQSNTMNLGAAPDTDTDGDSDVDADTDSDSDNDSDSDADTDTGTETDTCTDTEIGSGPYLWHTFYGGEGNEYSEGIAASADGRVVAVGFSTETWNGPSGEAPLHAHSIGGDMFALALAPDGAYLWHTFFGAPEGCVGVSAAFTASGDIVVVGASGGTWNGPSGEAPLDPFTGDATTINTDAFVLALSADGDYLWHAFFGSTADEMATGVAADGSGRVVVSGNSAGAWSGPGGETPLHLGASDVVNAFAISLDENGAYAWHTFYGVIGFNDPAFNGENGPSAAIAPTGEVILGITANENFEGEEGAEPLNPWSGSTDAVVLALAPDGGYLWHAFYGGSGEEYWLRDVASDVVVSPSGTISVVGRSGGGWFGPGDESPLETSGDNGIFVLALDVSGTYEWHTFLGGFEEERLSIANASDGGFVAAGQSDEWLGPGGEAPLHAFVGDEDFVDIRVAVDGAYAWHAFLGGEGSDGFRDVATDAAGGIVTVGDSYASWDGPCGAPPLHAHSGGWDFAIVKLGE